MNQVRITLTAEQRQVLSRYMALRGIEKDAVAVRMLMRAALAATGVDFPADVAAGGTRAGAGRPKGEIYEDRYQMVARLDDHGMVTVSDYRDEEEQIDVAQTLRYDSPAGLKLELYLIAGVDWDAELTEQAQLTAVWTAAQWEAKE